MPTERQLTAIITGASRGLGRALARELITAGWTVIADGRDAAALTKTAAEIDTESLVAVPGDITDPAHRDALIATAWERGGLDLLINNAGTLGPSPLPRVAEIEPAALREIYEANVIAPVALTQLALPLLSRANGVLINITSDAAAASYPGWGGYGSSKAALEHLSATMTAEQEAVVVWQVDPGDLRTKMHQDAFPGEDISDRPIPESVAPGLLGLLRRRPPAGRYRLGEWVPAIIGQESGAA